MSKDNPAHHKLYWPWEWDRDRYHDYAIDANESCLRNPPAHRTKKKMRTATGKSLVWVQFGLSYWCSQ